MRLEYQCNICEGSGQVEFNNLPSYCQNCLGVGSSEKIDYEVLANLLIFGARALSITNNRLSVGIEIRNLCYETSEKKLTPSTVSTILDLIQNSIQYQTPMVRLVIREVKR